MARSQGLTVKDAYTRVRAGQGSTREMLEAHAVILSNMTGVGSSAALELIAEALAELIAHTLERE